MAQHFSTMSADLADQSSMNKIYVGDLPRNVTEEWIRGFFKECGEILNVSKRTFYKNANAYVTFKEHKAAEKAIQELNYTKVNKIPIRISWFDQTSKINDPKANLVISNLPVEVDEAQLHETLKTFGNIRSCRIQRNRSGESNGIGYVSFSKTEDAKNALESLQNATIENNTITVEYFKPNDERQDILSKLPPTVLCIEGPKELLQDDKLRESFSGYGKILNTFIVEDHGVIIFENQSQATKANSELTNDKIKILTSVRRELQFAVLRRIEESRVYVSDIAINGKPDEVSAQVKAHLEKVGKLISFELQTKETNAYAQYESKEIRDKAIKELNHTTFGDQITPIAVLPFFEKRLEHQPAGLLQVNELPAEMTYENLRDTFSKYGNIIACCIVPTSDNMPIGYILFEQHESAKQAHAECKNDYPNTFAYPPINPSDIISGFCNNGKSRTVACYEIAKEETTETFRAKLRENEIISIVGLSVVPSKEGKKTAYVTLSTYEDAIKAIKYLKSQNIKCDLLGFHMLIKVRFEYMIAKDTNIRKRLIFCKGFGNQINNKQLRETFEVNGDIEFANIQYDALNGEPDGKALILFADQKGAIDTIQFPPYHYDFNNNFEVDFYKTKRELNPYYYPTPAIQSNNKSHEVPKPKDSIRNFIKKEAPEDKKAKLLAEVEKMCINEIIELQYNPEAIKKWMNEKIALLN